MTISVIRPYPMPTVPEEPTIPVYPPAENGNGGIVPPWFDFPWDEDTPHIMKELARLAEGI